MSDCQFKPILSLSLPRLFLSWCRPLCAGTECLLQVAGGVPLVSSPGMWCLISSLPCWCPAGLCSRSFTGNVTEMNHARLSR